MARYAQLVATGLPPGAPVTIKQNGKQVSNLFPAADATAPDNRARTGDRSGALSPATFVPNGTYTVAWSGGSKTVVVAGASGLPIAIPFDMATQAELDAISGADLSGYPTKAGTETITGAWTFNIPPLGIPSGGGGALPNTADAVRYVSGTGLDANDGLTAGTPKLTLQAAYTSLPSTGGKLFVAPGRYDVGAGWNLTRGKPVSLIGTIRPPAYISSVTTAPLTVKAAIIYTSANAASLITTTAGTAGNAMNELRFENLLFELSGTATTVALDMTTCSYGEVTGCYFWADKTTGPAPVTAQGMYVRPSTSYGDSDASWWRVWRNRCMNMALGTFGNATGTKLSCNQQVIKDNVGLGRQHTDTTANPFISVYGGHRCVVRDNNFEAYNRGLLMDTCNMCMEDGDGGEFVDVFIDMVNSKGNRISPLGIEYAGLGNNSSTTPYLQDAKLVRGDAFTKANILILPSTWTQANTQRLYQPTDDALHPAIAMSSTDNEIISPRNSNSQGNRDLKGTGSPEGVIVGLVGDTFRRQDGGSNSTLYVKESGTGNTGWIAYGAAVTGAVSVVARTSDAAAITASTTLTADGVLKFAIGASATEVWFFDAFLLISAANGAMDLQVGLSGPTSFTAAWGNGDIGGSSANPGFFSLNAASTPPAALGAGGVVTLGTAAQQLLVHVSGWVFGAGTAGDLALTFAQATSDAGNLVVKKGSHLKYYKVAS